MAARSDSLVGRMALAVQTAPPLLRLTLPPRLARFLIAAGARPAPTDKMSVGFRPWPSVKADREDDYQRSLAVRRLAGQHKLALAILRARRAVMDTYHQLQSESGDRDNLKRSMDALDVAVAEVWGAAPWGMGPNILTLDDAVKLAPNTYDDDDAHDVADIVHSGHPVLLDLRKLSHSDAKRFLDFASGLAAGLNGTIDHLRYGDPTILVSRSRVRRTPAPVLNLELGLALDELLDLIRLSYQANHATDDMHSRRARLVEWLRPETLPLDLSGLDLRDVTIKLDPTVLAGAIWSDDTKWPSSDIGSRIRDQSDKIGPNVYRVRTDYNLIVIRYLPDQ